MAFKFAKYNKKYIKIDWGINTEGFEYYKCSDQRLGEPIRIYGFFITKDTGYGEGAVLILKDKLLNLPARYVDQIKEMQQDEDLIAAVKAGEVGIVITEFDSQKYKRKGYDVEFVDI